jgi:hypothetical protein
MALSASALRCALPAAPPRVRRAGRRAAAARCAAGGSVTVVGLGPGACRRVL